MFLLLLSLLTVLKPLDIPQNDHLSTRLAVQVIGMESEKGSIQVAVFNSADRFLEHPCHQRTISITSQDTVQAEFELPPGQYAIAVYHDTNQNQELDKNFFGIPQEAYGFSNNARGSSMGPPSFEDTKITLGKKQQTVCIKLR